MIRRVKYLLCVSLCVYLSVTTLTAASFISTIKLWYELSHFQRVGFRKIASFTSYTFAHLDRLKRYCSDPCFFPTVESTEVVQRLTVHCTLLELLVYVCQRDTCTFL